MSSLLLIFFFLFALATWFVEPLGTPDPQITEAGIVAGAVTFLAGMGVWLVATGLSEPRARR
jgi:hypothetical protein